MYRQKNHVRIKKHNMPERAPQKHIFLDVSKYLLHLHTLYTTNAVPRYYLWYGAINGNISTHTNFAKIYLYASELSTFWHFHVLKLLFLSLFCWYFRYFVVTNDMLVGLHVPTDFQMYRQNSVFFLFFFCFFGGATGYASAVHTIALALIFWWMYHTAYFTVGSCIIFQIETDVVVHLPCLHFLGELLRSTVHIIKVNS